MMDVVVRKSPDKFIAQMKESVSGPDQALLQAHPELVVMVVEDWREAFRPGIGGAPKIWTICAPLGVPASGDHRRCAPVAREQDNNVSPSVLITLLTPSPTATSGFAPYLTWLEERRETVPCRHPAPVHWDFHPANVLLCEDDSAVVIDWTQIEISDARFDLAWTLLLVGTQQAPQWRDRILHEYERLAGNNVEEIAYFEVVASVKRLASVAMVLSGNAEKIGMRSDAAGMIREQLGALRKVYDLLVERTGITSAEIEEMLS